MPATDSPAGPTCTVCVEEQWYAARCQPLKAGARR